MSYTFNGSTHRLTSTATPIPSGSSFTLFCWVKLPDATPAADITPLAIGPLGGSDDYAHLVVLSTGNVRAKVNGAAAFTTSTVTDTVRDLQNGTWAALAGMFTNDGSNNITNVVAWVYNGTDESTASAGTTSRAISPWFGDISVGRNVTSVQNVTGDIAHVAIFNRELTAGELTDLIEKTPDASSATSALYAYWPLLTDAVEVIQGGGTLDFTVTDATLNSGDGPTLSSGSSSIAPLAAYYRMLNG